MARAYPYLLLLAEVLLFFRLPLFSDGYVIPWDLRYDHYPIAAFVADSFERGELPLWDPYTYCGRPLYANIQAQVFYPPMIAITLLSKALSGDHLFYLLEWQLILHISLGGVFTYLLLRKLGTSAGAALTGATVYQLGGFFASQAQHLGAVDAAGWMPFTWLAIVHLREKITLHWSAWLAAGFAMTIFAGLPALTAVAFSAALLFAVALTAFRLAPWKLPVVVVGAGAFSALLSAIQLFPSIELTWNSVAQYRDQWLGSGGGLPLKSLVSLVAPNYYHVFDMAEFTLPYNLTFLYLYGGYVGLALCLAAAVLPRRRETAMMAVMTLVCAFWMLGDSTPVGAAVYAALPAFISIGLHPEFALAAFCLSFAVLAGLGCDQFLRKPALAHAAALIAAADLILVSSGRTMNAYPTEHEPGVTAQSFDGSTELLDGLRRLVDAATPPWRVDTAGDSLNWAMSAPLTRVPSANGNDPFSPARLIAARLAFVDDGERWGRYYEVDKLASPVLDLMNVRYVLSYAPIDPVVLEEAGFTPAGPLPYRETYENLEALPRFFLVSRVRNADGLDQAAEWLSAADFDPSAEAIVEGPVAPLPPDATTGSVAVKEYQPRRLTLETESAGPSYLVTSETQYPGWRAFIDGVPAHLFYTDVAFRGLPVPAGRHEIVMEFAPAILWRSAGVSAIAWLLWSGVLVRRR